MPEIELVLRGFGIGEDYFNSEEFGKKASLPVGYLFCHVNATHVFC